MFRSTSLVAAGSVLGLLLPFVTNGSPPAGDGRAQEREAPAAQEQHASPAKTGVHATFARLVGDYDVATKFTMPDGKVMESKGTAKISTILDGRFLMEQNEGELMGKKIQGLRIYGWNAEAKQFEGLWLYTESNGMMRMTGKAGSDRRSVEFEAVAQETADQKMDFSIKCRRNQDGTLGVTMVCKGQDGEAQATFEETYTPKAKK